MKKSLATVAMAASFSDHVLPRMQNLGFESRAKLPRRDLLASLAHAEHERNHIQQVTLGIKTPPLSLLPLSSFA